MANGLVTFSRRGLGRCTNGERVTDQFVSPIDESWRADAACRGAPTDWFFPELGRNATEAHACCEACPVQRPCLEYALVTGETRGVWGNTSPKARKTIASRRRREAARLGRIDVVPIAKRLIALRLSGYSDSEIAEEFGVSLRTIQRYWNQIRALPKNPGPHSPSTVQGLGVTQHTSKEHTG